jgi:AcrR family transcriptional regulator
LLDAGAALADRTGLASMTVDAVVQQAGTGKGTFYRHFPDQSAFLSALHERFLAGLRSALGDATTGCQPGATRLKRVLIAYLNGCFGQRGLKAFLTEGRVVPDIQFRVDRALREFADLISSDLKAMDIDHPSASAQLVVAMAYEVAMAEQAAGRRQRSLRGALIDLATRGHPSD